jgi:mannose/fructose/N-acetylgalactosamine-specific phosphotransferase system component IID
MSTKRLLGTWDLMRMFFRSFFMQAVWNYHSLLSIGLCYTLFPAARKIFTDRNERIKFLYRHLNFFNSHPYFASFAVGSIARVEEEQLQMPQTDPESVERLKNALIGPLGAIGDQVFWATIKPSSILVGVLGILVLNDLRWQLAVLVVMLLIYNVPHLYIRWGGLKQGYRLGFEVYKVLNLEVYKKLKFVYSALGAITLGGIIAYSCMKFGQVEWQLGLLFLVSMGTAFYIWKWRQNFYQAALFSIAIAFLLELIFELL